MNCACGLEESCPTVFRQLEVMWWDANESSNSGWMSKAAAIKVKPCKIKSIGYLIKQTDDFITGLQPT